MGSRSGRGWAYFTMLAMLAVSVAGNISHTLHINPDPSMRQLVYAVFWPFGVWLAVEMFVRVQWQDTITHLLVRWAGMMLPASIAALVSYRHLRGLLKADSEEWIVYTFGPLAIDGLMLMATLALLLTRKLPVPDGPIVPVSQIVQEFGEARETLEEELARITLADMLPQPIEASVSPAPAPAPASSARTPRAGNGEREQMVRDMLADPELKPANSTMRRYASVARTLRSNPQQEVDAKGVRPEIVENIIRPWAMLERVR